MSNPPKKLNTKNTEKYAKLNITKKRLDKLIPHPKNARFHPESQIEKIVEWLAKLGYYKPIVIQVGTDYVLAGHGVLKSLLTDGYTHADVSETDNPEEWAALALMLWDNKSGELSFWDQPNLIAAEAELIEMDVKMETMGFQAYEIDSVKDPGQTPEELWEDMPEFEQEDLDCYQQIIIRFDSIEDVEGFAKAIGRTITPETKYMNIPKSNEYGYDKEVVYADSNG
jgi:hypothetical protein